MNESVALASQRIGGSTLDDFLALLALPSQRRSAGELPGYVAKILEEISSPVDGWLLRAVAAQSAQEFRTIREQLFLPYAKTITSLAKIVRSIVPDEQIERAVEQSFCEIEAEVRDHGLERFGQLAKDQAVFTVWTFRRMSGLITKIVAGGPAPETDKKRDEQLAEKFNFYCAWAQFNLDCMLVAMRYGKPIQIDVLPQVVDGLRAAVNAYGYARQGLDLRVPRQEPIIPVQDWDEEDQELLDSSMRDIEVEALDD